ncbi:chemotaxis protein CheW [Roseivivax isoporae]|uniref:CheW-like domain-containing protein n=1 Tax=Roseivivax isoporae LMG 25204 TaxID=1449351 RepID=X7FB73_9RHOB|nr:chemotaxis protein CheW [Roseivivax isoporae]ETX29349.1 hypothetical protein RISW2_01380 [Roseivivax isoporae LMG 25204]
MPRLDFGLLDIGRHRIAIGIEHLSEVCLVQGIVPMLCGRPEVFGLINLRGAMIPVLDPHVLCGMPRAEQPPTIAAILERDGRALALGIDRINGIAEIAADDIQTLYHDADRAGVMTGGFLHERDTVSILDPARIFARPDLPASGAVLRARRVAASEDARAFLIFAVGGAQFGLEAIRIFGTVPRQAITRDALTCGACLGSIRYHDRRVPVMAAGQVFGLGRRAVPDRPEVVVMRFPGERLVGFAVDVICRIRLVRDGETRGTAGIFGGTGRLFSKALVDPDGEQTFLLDADALEQDTDLHRAALLSDPPVPDAGRAAPPDGTVQVAGGTVIHEALRHVVFHAGRLLATPILQLVHIVEPPTKLTPVEAHGSPLLGLFSVDGLIVPLVSLARLIGARPAVDPPRARVLLVGPAARRIGFLVDSVDGIETSTWWAEKDTDLLAAHGVVKLRSPDRKSLVPRVDLERLATELVF